jgi:hypothetical protein
MFDELLTGQHFRTHLGSGPSTWRRWRLPLGNN